jgi:uncharacterized protein (TIGR00251 family)
MGRIAVVVAPGAKRTELVGRHGDGWKIRVAAPPERGRANDAVCELLAGITGVRREDVRVVAGAGSRRKIVEVSGVDAAGLERRLGREAP